MPAPSPVSSLVHSSTLVTTWVYLLFRFNHFFGLLIECSFVVVSGLTLFIAGLEANFEHDLSKIISLSTKVSVASLVFIQTFSVCSFLFVKP
jgi:NADH-ubiquinone oxidoreductase chain 5